VPTVTNNWKAGKVKVGPAKKKPVNPPSFDSDDAFVASVTLESGVEIKWDEKTEKQCRALIDRYVKLLDAAVKKAWRTTRPHVAFKSAKKVQLAPNVIWPNGSGSEWEARSVSNNGNRHDLHASDHVILKACDQRPEKIVAAVKALQKAIKWCEQTARIREREAQSILESEKGSLEELAVMLVAEKLRGKDAD
jgi:hypothetical protein